MALAKVDAHDCPVDWPTRFWGIEHESTSVWPFISISLSCAEWIIKPYLGIPDAVRCPWIYMAICWEDRNKVYDEKRPVTCETWYMYLTRLRGTAWVSTRCPSQTWRCQTGDHWPAWCLPLWRYTWLPALPDCLVETPTDCPVRLLQGVSELILHGSLECILHWRIASGHIEVL